MPIIYALVASSGTILAEWADREGDFKDIAREIVAQAPKEKHRKAYEAENLYFNYTCDENGLMFLCITTPESDKKLPWVFLPDIRHQFLLDNPAGSYELYAEFDLNEEFGQVLKEQMQSFNETPIQDKVKELRKEVSEVADVMRKNITKYEREHATRVDRLTAKTERLAPQTEIFVKESKRSECAGCLRNIFCCCYCPCCAKIFCCC